MLEKVSIINWLLKNKIKTEDGTPLDLHSHLFMVDVFKEMAKCKKNLVCLKAAQIGFSTTAVLSSFWIAKNRGVDIIYTLPTGSDVWQFAGGKINRIVAQNPVLQEWVKDKDTMEQKAIDDNIIYYRGTFTSKSALMVSSDLNIYDEIDASNQEVIEQYSTRLQHSDLKLEWYFSHPSIPGYGVSKHWEKSDQRHWFVKCKSCEREQYLSFPESIDEERKIFICKYCFCEITDEDRRTGRWVQKYKDRELTGFWIPLLICPWISAEDILNYKKEKSEEYFYNKVLGLPYAGGDNIVDYSIIERNFTSTINKQEGRIVIGVDTGVNLHYVIGNADGLFYYGEATAKENKGDPYNKMHELAKRFPRSIFVFDAGGDLIGSRKFREAYPGRVFLCHYGSDRKTMQLLRWGKGKEAGNVVADRNRMIQLVIDEFADRRIPLQGGEKTWWDYWLHWKAIYAEKEETKLGTIEKRWKRSGDDHWVHATVYWRIGMDRFGTDEADIIKPSIAIQAQRGVEVNPDQTIPVEKEIFKFYDR
ncbi:phage terminase large subunit family protein [Persephonella sp.]